ncbi:MAG: hypothetical protein AAGJ87_16000, partial [Pseudomonadota bacterium]
ARRGSRKGFPLFQAAFRPDILILDEWLSAGDQQFKAKARDRLDGLIKSTGIFAFASHNEALQKSACNKGVVLAKGSVQFVGPIDEAFEAFKAAPKG